jgi:hypothetical protein
MKATPTREALPRAEVAKQVEAFIDKFTPDHQKLIRAVRRVLRKRMPAAHEMVYDNYNFFVIGYSTSERPSDAILSIAAAANGVGLCFMHGARLRDPKNVLSGSGNQTRFLRLPSVDVLARPEVDALVASAIAAAKTPMPDTGRGRLTVRSISARQRPRRRASA